MLFAKADLDRKMSIKFFIKGLFYGKLFYFY